MACKLIVSALIGILAMGYAQADEQFGIIESGGGWDALAHTKSRLSKKDACIVDSHGINAIVLIGGRFTTGFRWLTCVLVTKAGHSRSM